jgi:hypothetical protein
LVQFGCGAARRLLDGGDAYLRALGKPREAGCDHAVAGAEPGAHDSLRIVLRAECEVAH